MDNEKQLHTAVDKIQNAETIKDLYRELGILYQHVSSEIRKDNKEYVHIAENISRFLHKHARKLDGEKAYTCGYWSKEFTVLVEKYQEKRAEASRMKTLSNPLVLKLMDYLYEHGCVKMQMIVSDFNRSQSDIEKIIEEMAMVDFVRIDYAINYIYCDLSATGYLYYNTKIKKWRAILT